MRDTLRLQSYVAGCVVGEAGAFSLPVTHRGSFVQTLLAMMVHGIACRGLSTRAQYPAQGVASPFACWQSEIGA